MDISNDLFIGLFVGYTFAVLEVLIMLKIFNIMIISKKADK